MKSSWLGALDRGPKWRRCQELVAGVITYGTTASSQSETSSTARNALRGAKAKEADGAAEELGASAARRCARTSGLCQSLRPVRRHRASSPRGRRRSRRERAKMPPFARRACRRSAGPWLRATARLRSQRAGRRLVMARFSTPCARRRASPCHRARPCPNPPRRRPLRKTADASSSSGPRRGRRRGGRSASRRRLWVELELAKQQTEPVSALQAPDARARLQNLPQDRENRVSVGQVRRHGWREGGRSPSAPPESEVGWWRSYAARRTVSKGPQTAPGPLPHGSRS